MIASKSSVLCFGCTIEKQKVKLFVSKKVLHFIKENTLDKKQNDAYIFCKVTKK